MTPDARLDLQVWPIFYEMSRRGLAVSFARLDALKEEVEAKMGEQLAAVEFYAEGESFNPSSGDQFAVWLETNGFKGKKTPGGRLATDERSLRMMDPHPVIDAVLEYRGLRKLATTFIEPVVEIARKHVDPDNLVGYVHPRWRLTKVKSGRVACEDPNLLAFPSRDEMGKRVRSCFVARPGFVFVGADYSQLEPRIVAAESGDPELLRIYRENLDLYSEIASALGVPRQVAKILTLGVLYGMSGQRLFEQLQLAGLFRGDPPEPTYSLEACEELIQNWFAKYSGVKHMVNRVVSQARRNDGWARTAGGRGRLLPGLFLDGWGWPAGKLREEAERQAFNHRVQGTGMEKLKEAMVRIHDACIQAYPMLAIHDELIYEVPRDKAERVAAQIADEMVTYMDGGVALKVEYKIGEDWGGLK